jgi:hypothetical protein
VDFSPCRTYFAIPLCPHAFFRSLFSPPDGKLLPTTTLDDSD